jgi:hypothetical protein
MLIAIWRRDPVLSLTGLGCLAVGLAGLVVLLAHGRYFPPEGDLAKPIAFDIALGIYVLTLAYLGPLAGFTPRQYRLWRVAQVIFTAGSVAIENIQTLRGIDPRFARMGGVIDVLASVAFGLFALGGFGSFLIFAIQMFRRRLDSEQSVLVLAVRYASVAVIVGYATGLWMIANGGAAVGVSGDILPLHALGLHGLQGVTVVALLLRRSRLSAAAASLWVHVAGCAWLIACACLLWQTLRGRSVAEVTPVTGVALTCVLVWMLVAAYAARACYFPQDAPRVLPWFGPRTVVAKATAAGLVAPAALGRDGLSAPGSGAVSTGSAIQQS